jgi:hypothetical protein
MTQAFQRENFVRQSINYFLYFKITLISWAPQLIAGIRVKETFKLDFFLSKEIGFWGTLTGNLREIQ